ncbi:MAG TPA: iron-sulfur cluster repair di-iron protein [Bryobacteraceae bacterium]|jgi:regulator of cell morphogenesis and NO signaling
MSVTTEKTVRELALGNPTATRVFEKLGIDYCCGGGQTLEQACQAAHVSISQVAESLAAASQAASASAPDQDWQSEPLSELLAHIQSTHHVYTREEIARLGPLFDKVCSVHGKNHPELLRLREVFRGLAEELTTHLMKEEMVLFPYIVRMEEAVVAQEPVLPPPFGSVRNPVAMMMSEHDGAGSALRSMRQISNGYTAPPDACVSFQTLYQALAAFEADLHQHIHLENNVLFPRAIEMEQAH